MAQFIGIDPGGEDATGWCVLGAEGAKPIEVITGVCTGVSECFSAVRAHINGEPFSIGIDAPLFWTASGDRLSDRRIRSAVVSAGGKSGTVSHVNSLRGACLVQGVLAAATAANIWPLIKITEAHPKALLRLWPEAGEFVRGYQFRSEHERDAALGAYSALAFFERRQGWIDWASREKDFYVPGAYVPAYWFPECEASTQSRS